MVDDAKIGRPTELAVYKKTKQLIKNTLTSLYKKE